MKKIIIILLSLIIVISCTVNAPDDQAGTSEQGNARYSATIYNSDGTPAADALVRIRPVDYVTKATLNKIKLLKTRNLLTDSTGSFTIDSLDAGSYSIEVTNCITSAALFHWTITEEKKDNIYTIDTLHRFATVKGRIDFNASRERRFVLVEGLERLVEVDTAGNYSIDDLPEGIYTLQIVSSDTSSDVSTVKNVKTTRGEITIVPYNEWLYKKQIVLNTTTSGADIASNLYNFPVLIRLNKNNFKFDEAKADGADFRIYKSETDTIPVPFEIERWDSAGAAAEIWVKVDTVYANSSKEYFTMKWGNPFAYKLNLSAKTFDTLNGFGGVWHLAKSENGLTPDATANSFNGTVANVGNSQGVIGNSGKFNGSSSYITIENSASGKLNFPIDGYYTVSAWVYSDRITSNRSIVCKGFTQYQLKIQEFNWNFAQYRDQPSPGWEHTLVGYSFGKWVYLCGVQKGSSQYLYINGVCVDTTKALLSGTEKRDESFDVEIGSVLLSDNTRGLYFQGSIDEVRICTVARNEDWIKLCYSNQGSNDVLVTFSKE